MQKLQLVKCVLLFVNFSVSIIICTDCKTVVLMCQLPQLAAFALETLLGLKHLFPIM